jgi:hypothetical protein
MSTPACNPGPTFDAGHRSDVDCTQILQSLRLTPDQRLERHEGWRLFVKEALRHAGVHQGNDPEAGGRAG